MNEKQLLQRARGGDKDALGELLLAHEKSCFALALRLTGSVTDARDVCQDAFLRATRDLAGAHVRDLRSWLFGLVAHAYYDRKRSDAARRRREEITAMQRNDKHEPPAAAAAEQSDLRHGVDTAMAQLEDRYRLPITMYYEQGLSHEGISQALKIPIGTVKTHLHRGLEHLRDILSRAGYACALPVLVSTLQRPAEVHVPPELTVFVKGLSVATATKGVAAGSGSLAALWKAATACLVLLAVLGGGFVGWHFWFAAPALRSAPPAGPLKAWVSANPTLAFNELSRNGGARVVMLGGNTPMAPWNRIELFVPVSMRHQRWEARPLIEGIAAANGLKVAWMKGDTLAVLEAGASDADVARIAEALKSNHIDARIDAAAEAGWMPDTRLVGPLLAAVSDRDPAVRFQAARSVFQLGLSDVIAIGGAETQPLLELMLADASPRARAAAAKIIWRERLKFARPLLKIALRDEHREVFQEATFAESQFNIEALREDKSALPVDKAEIEREFSSQNDEDRLSAVMHAAALQPEDAVPLLKKALQDSSDDVRVQAVESLARVSGDDVFTLLTPALKDRCDDVRLAAVTALAQTHDARAAALLGNALTDTRELIRSQAVLGLRFMASADAVPMLEKAASDASTVTHREALKGLSYVGGAQAVEALRKIALSADNADVFYALGDEGSEAAVTTLEHVLNDSDDFHRQCAMESLGRVGTARARALIEAGLKDADALFRENANAALQTHATLMQASSLPAAPAQDPAERAQAVMLAGRLGGEPALAALKAAVSDPDSGVRAATAKALGRLGGEVAFTLVSGLAADSDSQVRAAAVKALGDLGGIKAETLIENALADPQQAVRMSAASALATLATEQSLARLDKFFSAADVRGRRGIVTQCDDADNRGGVIGNAPGPSPLNFLEKALRDAAPEVRLAAIDTLERNAHPRAADILMAGLTLEKDPAVRGRIVGALDRAFRVLPEVRAALKDEALKP